MTGGKHISDTKFFNDLLHGVYGPRQGGARIIVDAEDAETGVGKTALAVALARYLAGLFGYEMKKDDFTLSGGEYLDRWRNHPDKDQPSVIVLDELSGAGAGDSRRAMSNQNVNLGRSWQLMRKKRIVTIVTLPHWSDADKKMRRFADYKLWCLQQPIGYFRPYSIGATFDKGETKTEKIGDCQRIKFPNMPSIDDPLYRYVSELKDDLLDSTVFDADELHEDDDGDESDPEDVRREEKVETAQKLREKGISQDDIGEIINRDQSWVSRKTSDPSKSGS